MGWAFLGAVVAGVSGRDDGHGVVITSGSVVLGSIVISTIHGGVACIGLYRDKGILICDLIEKGQARVTIPCVDFFMQDVFEAFKVYSSILPAFFSTTDFLGDPVKPDME